MNWEALFTGCLKEELYLTDILQGLQNACCHGEHIAGGSIEQKDLTKLHKGLDKALAATRVMEGT